MGREGERRNGNNPKQPGETKEERGEGEKGQEWETEKKRERWRKEGGVMREVRKPHIIGSEMKCNTQCNFYWKLPDFALFGPACDKAVV